MLRMPNMPPNLYRYRYLKLWRWAINLASTRYVTSPGLPQRCQPTPRTNCVLPTPRGNLPLCTSIKSRYVFPAFLEYRAKNHLCLFAGPFFVHTDRFQVLNRLDQFFEVPASLTDR